MELRCDELTKQYEDVRRLLEQERRKNERIQESSSSNLNESVKVNLTTSLMPVDGSSEEHKNRHILGSASEPETEEVRIKKFKKELEVNFVMSIKRLPHQQIPRNRLLPIPDMCQFRRHL